jgi:hypothetical protein
VERGRGEQGRLELALASQPARIQLAVLAGTGVWTLEPTPVGSRRECASDGGGGSDDATDDGGDDHATPGSSTGGDDQAASGSATGGEDHVSSGSSGTTVGTTGVDGDHEDRPKGDLGDDGDHDRDDD